MKAPLAWLREFVAVPRTADEIGARLSLRGLALEGIESSAFPSDAAGGADAVLDFDVTANRPDCLSIAGIAREIATAYQLPLLPAHARRLTDARGSGGASDVANEVAHRMTAGASVSSDLLSLSIADSDLCPRYVAAVADVTIAPSPAWMQARLTACGIRPINNIVDITNYVLLERGYPMHAFDYSRLAGPAIVARRARAGELLTTLDGKKRTLDEQMLVIADRDGGQAIGGVMGGADSEVSASTRRVVFEAAWFTPASVRATSKRLGLRSEASYRFERGVDLTATADAMSDALALLEHIGAGQPVGPMLDCYPLPHQPRELTVDLDFVRRLLGMHVPDADAVRILTSLGFLVACPAEPSNPTTLEPSRTLEPLNLRALEPLTLTVPGWRGDVQRPVDVAEEVGRHYGFEHLPATFPALTERPGSSDPRIARDARVRRALVGAGISEAVTFSFIEAQAATPFGGDDPAVTLANPLSEKFAVMRPTLLAGLVDSVSHNRRHGQRDVRLFEIGTRFSSVGESRGVAVAWTGAAAPDHWSGHRREVDFFDVKGLAEQMCALFFLTPTFVEGASRYLVPGRAAELRTPGDAGETVGRLGQLTSDVIESRHLPGGDAVYVLEIDLDRLSAHAPLAARVTTPLPRHPLVTRDLSILIADTLSADTVRGTIRSARIGGAGDDLTAGRSSDLQLVDVREFDRYQGKGIADGQVSLSLRLTFRAADRTLTDAEVQEAMDQIVSTLETALGAVQR